MSPYLTLTVSGRISKRRNRDSRTHTSVLGATYPVYDGEGVFLCDHVIIQLMTGTYVLSETFTPQGTSSFGESSLRTHASPWSLWVTQVDSFCCVGGKRMRERNLHCFASGEPALGGGEDLQGGGGPWRESVSPVTRHASLAKDIQMHHLATRVPMNGVEPWRWTDGANQM